MVQTKYRQRTPPALTPQEVRDIRELRLKKVSFRSLANRYGVSIETVRDAAHGEGAYREL